ncbi:hypothetical protein DAPPUDRAFT_304321 [Daphnia pulex]|uniref:Protein SirB1 N-terminal domain-containing protein n=1 Tax=Daphnia pulex TaxID=6669 RepID=E9GKP5_DAPPU|nr:hypothetical protein DAPPUDRAFT_304321 [Daphnia pulex]|eukprot:EFX79719.1 hypothetical protein DAPPUDRAFT_304321 [Daphnia pulex]
MGFTEMDKDDISNFDNVYVDKVLQTKRGHWLVLLVIYHEIAKRLGILCLPVTADSKYIILKHRATSKNGTVDIYINPSKGNAWKGLPVSESSPFRVVPANIFFIQLVKYLAPCGVLHFHLLPCASILNKKNYLHYTRLACMITSRKVSAIEGYARWCNHFGYQLEQAMELLKSLECHDHNCLMECIQNLSEQQALIANREIFGRLPWTKYAAGLVMIYNDQEDFLEEKVYVNSDTTDTAKYQHNASLPGRLCVIISAQCKCKFCNRTGYRVLFDNGNLVCVSEEHLKLHPEGAVINNPHIGIFFERFDGRRYIPNTELMTQFPEDDAFAKSLIG